MKNKNSTICNIKCINKDVVDRVNISLPKESIQYNLASFLKVLGDFTRIKILNSLLISEMCVCDLTEVVQISQSAISHQLRILRQANLVKFRKEGKIVYYSLQDQLVKSIIEIGLKHINEK